MNKQPTNDQWKTAYDLAAKIKELEPWRWMFDLDNFGFETPDTGEQGFICVMGHEDEHYGITIYRGTKSLFKVLNAIQNLAPAETAFLEIEGVSLSFEDRSLLKPKDRQAISELGLKFRGRNAWPIFRSHLPVHLPWFISADELEFLIVGLERLLEVASIWKDKNKSRELALASKNGQYLMCIPLKQECGDIVWKQEIRQIDPPSELNIAMLLNETDLTSAQKLTLVSNKYELSMSVMRNPIQEHPEQRPYFTYLMILVEAASGIIAGFDIVKADPTCEAAYAQLAPFLLKSLLTNQVIPEKIFVQSDIHAILLKPVSDKLGIKIKVKPTLPRSEDAITSLMNFQKGQ